MSPSVTDWMPPTRSERVGFIIRLSSVFAVSGRDKLDSTLGDGAGGVGVEFDADLVDDDDLGHVVFRRPSIITLCWNAGDLTCIRRARAQWRDGGCRRRPAISLEVSTTITRLLASSARDAGRPRGA